MKEVRFIFNVVAILAFITTAITFFASIGADITVAPQLLAFAGVMFFIAFASGLVGLLADWNLTRVDNHHSSLILTLATHQERNESTHQEKNKIWSSRKKQDPTVKS